LKPIVNILIFICLCFAVNSAQAANPAGGNITYKYVGPGTVAGTHIYYVEVSIFQDCQSLSTRANTLRITANCGSTTNNHTLNYVPFVAPTPYPIGGPYRAITLYGRMDAEEVSDLCDNVLNPSKSINSSCRTTRQGIPGYVKFIYAGNITISTCNYWTFGVSAGCCRAASVSLTGRGTIYLEAQFNNLGFPKNSAPAFSSLLKPFPTGCVSQPVSYGVGAVDPNGDSLVYKLTCARTSNTRCSNYATGYDSLNPVKGILLDSLTGQIKFTPKVVGKYVVAFWVKEYERCTGKWKGQILRDITFIINACSNKVPKDISGVTNLKGKNSVKLDKFKIQVCNGTIFSFIDTILDPDTADSLYFKSNHNDAMPGSLMKVTSLQKNKSVVEFSWKVDLANNPLRSFFVEFSDNSCNFPGHGLSVYEVQIVNSTQVGPDQAICKGDTSVMTASGGIKYEWRSLYGDSLIFNGPNQNIFGDTNATDTNKTVRFVPKNTTLIEVWSDLNLGCRKAYSCENKDTIKIISAPSFDLKTSNDTLLCHTDSSTFVSVKPDSSQFNYSYNWEPASPLSNNKIARTRFSSSKNTKLMVTVTSDSGCVKYDDVQVNVTLRMPDTVSIIPSISPLCGGLPTILFPKLGRQPTKCDTTSIQCVGARISKTSTDTSKINGSSPTGSAVNWPCPYGGAAASSRQQYLYTAAELNTLGIYAGTIDGLGFNVINPKGASFNNYTIKLKCMPTSFSSISGFQGAGAVVFTPKNVRPMKGWNMHYFDVNYDYDGSSNLLVEICYDNTGVGTNSSAAVAFDPTTFNSVVGAISSSGACRSQFLSLMSWVNRPTMQLSFCGTRDTSGFTYKWSPSANVDSSSAISPQVKTDTTIKIQLMYTDTFGKCTDSTSVVLDVVTVLLPADTVICPGDSFLIAPKITSSCKKQKFTWSNSQYLSNPNIKNPWASPDTSSLFVLAYRDSCGCIISDSILIYVDSIKPNLTIVPPSCTTNRGEIQIKSGGIKGPFKFSIDSGKTFQLDSNFINLSAGDYVVLVENTIGCKSKLLPTRLYNAGAPQIDSITETNLSCHGANDGILNIHFTGGGASPSFSIDSGTTWQSFNVFNGLEPGPYKILTRDINGCLSFPENASLTQPSEIIIDLKTIHDSCYNHGHGYAIAKGTGGTRKFTYQWAGKKLGATHNPAVINDSIYSQLFAFSAYRIRVLDATGCTADSTFTINEIAELQYDSISLSPTSCYGYDDGSIILKLKGGNKGDLFFSVDSGNNYVGSISSARPNEAHFNKNVNQVSLSKGYYHIRSKDSKGCLADTMLKVLEPSKITLTTPQDSFKICVSTCTKMEVNSIGGNSVNHKFHWTPSVSQSNVANVCPKENMIYTVYSSDKNGCSSNTLQMKVNLFDSLSVDIIGEPTLCRGDNLTITARAKGGTGSNYKYNWLPFYNLSNAFIKDVIASPTKNTTYTVRLSDSCGSPFAENLHKISVLELPKARFKVDNEVGCVPHEIYLESQSINASSCIWNIKGYNKIESCEPISKSFSIAGSYSVELKVFSIEGCSDSILKTDLITVNPLPEPNFSASPNPTTTINSTIKFKDLSEGKIISWSWNFSSIDTSFKPNPTFHFPDREKGEYFVRLDVVDVNNCTDFLIEKIFIDPHFSLYIPNSFSPNGDGINDTWRPISLGFNYDSYNVQVFDRWGNLIFISSDPTESWDGLTREGKEISVGVYSYRVSIGEDSSKKNNHERIGKITIIK